ncbi:hypothetical protein SAMN03159341_14317 [Paenibacillus sp. 1_12]|nr:hypothetical protein SAMN03159341_14317 [Paenibacillus sp. 1_12]
MRLRFLIFGVNTRLFETEMASLTISPCNSRRAKRSCIMLLLNQTDTSTLCHRTVHA